MSYFIYFSFVVSFSLYLIYYFLLLQSIPVVPPSLTTVFSIPSWSYASPTNHLNLVLLVGYGPNIVIDYQQGLLYSKDGQVYVSLNQSVTLSGGNADVSTSPFTQYYPSSKSDTPYFSSQLSETYGADATLNQVTISFPAGASGIIYPYTIGTGQFVEDGDWNSSSPIPTTASPTTSSAPQTAVVCNFLFVLFLCVCATLL